MRRIAFLAVLIVLVTPACYGPRHAFPDGGPVIGGRIPIGVNKIPRPHPPQTPCREVGRIPCDFMACGGPGMDYVTYHCQGTRPTGRCVANGGCTAGPDNKPVEKPAEKLTEKPADNQADKPKE